MENMMDYGEIVRTGSKFVLINDQPLGPAPKDDISGHRQVYSNKNGKKPFRAKEHKQVS